MLQLTNEWKQAYPQAHAGFLAMGNVANPARCDELERLKIALEADLRARLGAGDRKALGQDPILQAYAAYYRAFQKTYHVQLQLESILWKNKSIPSVAALVEAMFMAEVKNRLLTAGHDLDAVRGPITLDVARDGDAYTLLRGEEQNPKPGDMLMRDQTGILSSILYGPDRRTQIQPGTRNAAFTVYAPAGIPVSALYAHLEDIRDYILVISPGAIVGFLQVFGDAE
jgi:DNA/RNA-binding domain of Phe-tRNA-synthetase-like protein